MALPPIISSLGKGSSKQKDAEVVLNPPDALRTVLTHFPVYRDSYRTLLRMTIVLAILQAAGIIFILLTVITAKPQDRFFTSSVIGRNEQIYPADTPFDDGTVTRIVRSIIDAMSFGYISYQVRLDETKGAFASEEVQKKLIGFMTGSSGTQGLIQAELSFDVAFDDKRPFQIVQAGTSPDLTYEAIYDIPLLVTRKKGTEGTTLSTSPWLVRAVVRRAVRLDGPFPFVITDIFAAGEGAQSAAQSSTATSTATSANEVPPTKGAMP